MPHPWLSRRVVYPLQERLLKRPTFAYLESLEQSQWLSRTALERLQMKKLTELLDTATRHSPWHAERIRAAGLDIDEGARVTLDDLRRLPRMTKQDARDNVDRIRWPGVPGGAARYNTGGSSGEPLIFYFGRWRQASDAAGRIRARRWWGVDVGDREVYLWGAPAELNKTDRIKTVRDGLLNQLVLNAFAMSPSNMDAYLEAVQAFRPSCIYGYASSVALLAARASARGVRPHLPELRVVCATGEPLYPHQRKLIEEVFGVHVANEFGSRDIGFTAHATPQGQMLLMSESIILEVLDQQGNPVPRRRTWRSGDDRSVLRCAAIHSLPDWRHGSHELRELRRWTWIACAERGGGAHDRFRGASRRRDHARTRRHLRPPRSRGYCGIQTDPACTA